MSRRESYAHSPTGDSLGSLDDLLGDSGSPLSHNMSPSSPQLTFQNMSSHTIPNAVHMEVQENAKLPTFNLPVDRTNSSIRSISAGWDPATSKAIDDMVRLSENDVNLTELFLKSGKRSNTSMAYGGASADVGRADNGRHYSISSLGSAGFNDLLVSVDSNSSNVQLPASPSQSPIQQLSLPTLVSVSTGGDDGDKTAESSTTTPSKPDPHSYYPYGRRYPLPIPTKASSPITSSPVGETESQQSSDPLAVAIATAAAIAQQDPERASLPSVNATDNPLTRANENRAAGVPAFRGVVNSSGSHPLPSSANLGKPRPGTSTSKATANISATRTPHHPPVKLPPATTPKAATSPPVSHQKSFPARTPARSSAPLPAAHHRQSRPAPSSHAAAHSTSSASIKEATKRRAQFGFGGNHVVPSVPMPPPKSRSQLSKKGSQSAAGSKHHAVHTRHFPSPTAAYERKKQRAKDARVKLNDSIERLSISINLAGTQSKQRIAQMNGLDFNEEAGTKLEEYRQGALRIMQECQGNATAAKKWDRPSFVATAATLIQGLNSQCDAIMRVMMEWKMAMDQHSNLNAGATVIPVSTGDLNLSSTAESEESKPIPSSSGKAAFPPHPQGHGKHELPKDHESAPLKRQKTADGNTNVQQSHIPTVVSDASSIGEAGSTDPLKGAQESLFSSQSVLDTISSFLDPRSLNRCLAASRPWRNLKMFQNEETWQHLCMQRYGLVAVRRWKEIEQDESDNDTPFLSMATLYKKMDMANAKPLCHQEGNVPLGNGRIQGVVSAWVSLVERSNCETARSVKIESAGGSGKYTSLPVVQLRILMQNTGLSNEPLVIKDQVLTVDASTRRRGEELEEIQSDDRFKKMVLNVDGSTYDRVQPSDSADVVGELCRLRLFEGVVLVANIHARGCSTTSKFQQRANFAKVLVTLNGTAVPLVLPFARGKMPK